MRIALKILDQSHDLTPISTLQKSLKTFSLNTWDPSQKYFHLQVFQVYFGVRQHRYQLSRLYYRFYFYL